MKPEVLVGPCRDENEVTQWCDLAAETYTRTREYCERYLQLAGRENARLIRVDGRLVGGLVRLPAGQWFGGRCVAMTGIAAVAVAPECRAQGAATRLLRAALEELRVAGMPLSALYPATVALYRRVGYEPAGFACHVSVPAKAIDLRDRELTVRPTGPEDEPLIRDLYRRWAAGTNGNVDRSEFFWQRAHQPRGETTKGYLIERGREAEGYALLFTEPVDQRRYNVHVQDGVTLTPAAARRLLTLLADHRTIREQVTWRGGPADPWLALLSELPYSVECRTPWMLRLTHVPAALEARGYPAGVTAEVHLAIRDEVLPENAGRCVLRVAEGTGRVEPGGRGSVEVDVRGLAALYSGYRSVSDLRLLGLLTGPAAEAAMLDTLFLGPLPWMRDEF